MTERTSSMLDETESKTIQKDEKGDPQRKKKTMSEVKPVENISKNLQTFLKISPVQREVLPKKEFLNCETMHMSTRVFLD